MRDVTMHDVRQILRATISDGGDPTGVIAQILSMLDMVRAGPQDLPSQEQTLAWVASRWPSQTTPYARAAKLCEEAGEVMGAAIKIPEGRKTMADLRQETAQVGLVAMSLAEAAGFDLWVAMAEEHKRVTAAAPAKCPACGCVASDELADCEDAFHARVVPGG